MSNFTMSYIWLRKYPYQKMTLRVFIITTCSLKIIFLFIQRQSHIISFFNLLMYSSCNICIDHHVCIWVCFIVLYFTVYMIEQNIPLKYCPYIVFCFEGEGSQKKVLRYYFLLFIAERDSKTKIGSLSELLNQPYNVKLLDL